MIADGFSAVMSGVFLAAHRTLEAALHIQFHYVDWLILLCLGRRLIAEDEIQLFLKALNGPTGLFLVGQLADALMGTAKPD